MHWTTVSNVAFIVAWTPVYLYSLYASQIYLYVEKKIFDRKCSGTRREATPARRHSYPLPVVAKNISRPAARRRGRHDSRTNARVAYAVAAAWLIGNICAHPSGRRRIPRRVIFFLSPPRHVPSRRSHVGRPPARPTAAAHSAHTPATVFRRYRRPGAGFASRFFVHVPCSALRRPLDRRPLSAATAVGRQPPVCRSYCGTPCAVRGGFLYVYIIPRRRRWREVFFRLLPAPPTRNPPPPAPLVMSCPGRRRAFFRNVHHPAATAAAAAAAAGLTKCDAFFTTILYARVIQKTCPPHAPGPKPRTERGDFRYFKILNMYTLSDSDFYRIAGCILW